MKINKSQRAYTSPAIESFEAAGQCMLCISPEVSNPFGSSEPEQEI